VSSRGKQKKNAKILNGIEIEKYKIDLLDNFEKSIYDEALSKLSSYDTITATAYTSSNYENTEMNMDKLIELSEKFKHTEIITEICFTGEIEEPVTILKKYLCLPRKHKSTYLKGFNEYYKDISLCGIPVFDDDERYYKYICEAINENEICMLAE
jgi:hypothetical protein